MGVCLAASLAMRASLRDGRAMCGRCFWKGELAGRRLRRQACLVEGQVWGRYGLSRLVD